MLVFDISLSLSQISPFTIWFAIARGLSMIRLLPFSLC